MIIPIATDGLVSLSNAVNSDEVAKEEDDGESFPKRVQSYLS